MKTTYSAIQRVPEELDRKGAFHSAYNSGNVSQKSNGKDHFGQVRPKYLRLPLKLVHLHRSAHYRNVPIVSPVPLFCILLTRTKTQPNAKWSVQPECIFPLGTWNFRNFKPDFLLNIKGPECQAVRNRFSRKNSSTYEEEFDSYESESYQPLPGLFVINKKIIIIASDKSSLGPGCAVGEKMQNLVPGQTRGVRNPNLQVVITHTSHVCGKHLFGLPQSPLRPFLSRHGTLLPTRQKQLQGRLGLPLKAQSAIYLITDVWTFYHS